MRKLYVKLFKYISSEHIINMLHDRFHLCGSDVQYNINDTVGVCCNSEGLGDDEHNSDNYRGL